MQTPESLRTHQADADDRQFRCADLNCPERFYSAAERFGHYAQVPNHAATSRYSFDSAPVVEADDSFTVNDTITGLPVTVATAAEQTFANGLLNVQEYVENLIDDYGRKFEVSDFQAGGATDALAQFATQWAKEYSGDFEYMVEMHAQAVTGKLSIGQVKGVLNCYRADYLRRPKATVAPSAVKEGLDLSALPPSARGILHTAVQDQKTGDWLFLNVKPRGDGWVVTQEVGGNEDIFLGSQSPRSNNVYQGRRMAEVAALLADPKAAIIAYGEQSEHCGICGTKLSAKDSLERAMGPVCWGKLA